MACHLPLPPRPCIPQPGVRWGEGRSSDPAGLRIPAQNPSYSAEQAAPVSSDPGAIWKAPAPLALHSMLSWSKQALALCPAPT